MHHALRYARTSLEMAPTFTVLKPHLDDMLFKVRY
jgi:hypothetical protein